MSRIAPMAARSGNVNAIPMSGTSPMQVKGAPSCADDSATMRSQAKASDKPAPIAKPLTAATLALLLYRSCRNTSCSTLSRLMGLLFLAEIAP